MDSHEEQSGTIAIASDHAGYKLKESLKRVLEKFGISFLDLGTDNEESVDYPDFGSAIAGAILDGRASRGVALCGTGIGISIAINRHQGIRAALCNDINSTKIARKHNNANVLAMGARVIDSDTASECLRVFLNTPFEGERHQRRVTKIEIQQNLRNKSSLKQRKYIEDKDLEEAVGSELYRQQNSVELIASENFVNKSILEMQGSILTNKYAEGYPSKRYYGGCEEVDKVENLAINRAKELFGCDWVNVQPHSGSQANQSVYLALLSPGDKILGMSLSAGGHLTHGAYPNQSGKNYKAIQYGVNKDDGLINYDEVEVLATDHKPKLIIAGASAYSREIDFRRFRNIADKVDAYLMVDMAHYAGLIASKCYPDPLPYADVCTSTTHKTLRGPRGGIILGNNKDIGKLIDKAVFPGLQGGPLMHVIAAKAAAFYEALKNDFKEYSKQTIRNSKTIAMTLENKGFKVVSGGTDCHMVLIDLRSKGVTGKEAEKSLDLSGITCNKNSVPFDPQSPFITSGIRIGSAAGTTRGFKEKEFEFIGDLISVVIEGLRVNKDKNSKVENEVRKKILDLCNKFPLYE